MALASAAVVVAAAPADSEARRGSRAAFTTDKEFGLGVMLGAPSGLSGKYYLGDSSVALAFGAGVFYEFRHHEGTHLHLDVLWHPAILATADSFVLPLYLGVGGRILDHDDYTWRDEFYDDHTHIGVRAPVGIAFDFTNVPLDVFFELVLVADLMFLDDDDTIDDGHDTLDFNGAIGVRYYF
jgi:hypothetical protein